MTRASAAETAVEQERKISMGTYQIRSIRFLSLCAILALLVCPALSTDKKAAAPAKAAPTKAAPAAATHAPAAAGGTHGAAGAAHSSSPATTTHGPTTAGTGRTTTTTTGAHTTTTGTAHTAVGGNAGGAGHSTTNTTGAGHTTNAGGGRVPAGQTVTQAKNGASVSRRPDGRVASVHDTKRGMDVHRGLNGNRRVVAERPDHSRVFVEHGGHGYVQRPYMYHGHEYARRSYYYGGHYYNRYYGRYYYRGMYINPYYPSFYYAPGFYGWAYNPWATPVAFGWGWGGNPWYGYYGAYFTPYPVYASPALWLTDYMVATSLQAAYQAQVESQLQGQALSNPAPLTPETKALISEEVKRQIALENAEAQTGRTSEPDAASSSIQRALTDGVQHVFVAGQDLDVVDASGRECAISQGDALQLAGQNPPDATEVELVVLASKGGKECPRGDTVSVGLPELQDMQNNMRETIDQGMAELQKKQGKGGLPAAPASATAPPTESVMALNAPPPPPESEVASQLKQESQEADSAEKEAAGDTGVATASVNPPTVALGQSPDEVIGAIGKPKTIMDLGSKKIYVYPDMKVTFKAGKVTDIQ